MYLLHFTSSKDVDQTGSVEKIYTGKRRNYAKPAKMCMHVTYMPN